MFIFTPLFFQSNWLNLNIKWRHFGKIYKVLQKTDRKQSNLRQVIFSLLKFRETDRNLRETCKSSNKLTENYQ